MNERLYRHLASHGYDLPWKDAAYYVHKCRLVLMDFPSPSSSNQNEAPSLSSDWILMVEAFSLHNPVCALPHSIHQSLNGAFDTYIMDVQSVIEKSRRAPPPTSSTSDTPDANLSMLLELMPHASQLLTPDDVEVEFESPANRLARLWRGHEQDIPGWTPTGPDTNGNGGQSDEEEYYEVVEGRG